MGQTLTLTASDGHRLDAYLAEPAGKARANLVVIQEIFGVNVHIREVCDGFAADGYRAVAPALFDRAERGVELEYDAGGVARGRELRGDIAWDKVILDVEAARAHLAGQGKIGVVGYCWGGSVTWLAAAELDFDAAVGYYGGQIIEFNDRAPKCPTLLHFGEVDSAIPLSDVDQIRAAHANVPIHVYKGADHGFNCNHRDTYHAEASALARERTMAFFAEHLR